MVHHYWWEPAQDETGSLLTRLRPVDRGDRAGFSRLETFRLAGMVGVTGCRTAAVLARGKKLARQIVVETALEIVDSV